MTMIMVTMIIMTIIINNDTDDVESLKCPAFNNLTLLISILKCFTIPCVLDGVYNAMIVVVMFAAKAKLGSIKESTLEHDISAAMLISQAYL